MRRLVIPNLIGNLKRKFLYDQNMKIIRHSYPIKHFSISFLVLISFFLNSSFVLANDQDSFTKGLEYFQEGEHEKAIKKFELVVKADPNNADAHYYLGLAYSRVDKNNLAVSAFKKAIDLLHPELQNVNLSLGIAYYKSGDYDSALQTLNQVIELEPQNASAHFFVGLSLQKKNQHKKSIKSFHKAMVRDPEFNQLSLFNIGLAYSKIDQYEPAKDAFNKVIEIDPQSDIAKDSQKFLETLADKKEKKRWGITASVSWEHDDNLTREEQDIVTGEPDTAMVYEFGGEYKIIDTPKYGLDVSYDFFQSIYKKITNLNFQSHTLALSGSTEFEKWDAGINYMYIYNLLDDQDFLYIHTVTPNIGFSILPTLYTAVNYTFMNKKFPDSEGRNADNHSGSFSQFVFFMDGKAYLSLSYKLDDEDTVDNEFDYLGHLYTLGAQTKLPFESKINVSYKYSHKDFDTITSSIGEIRRDDKQTINVALTKKLFKILELKINYQYIDSRSNLESVVFTENILTAGVALSLP